MKLFSGAFFAIPVLFAMSGTLSKCQFANNDVTPAQIAADATGIVNELATLLPQIENVAPKAFSQTQLAQITNDISLAQKALANLSAGMPATNGASVAQQIDFYINDAVGALATVAPSIPVLAPYVLPIDAVEAILPGIEAFVNQYLPSSVTKASLVRTAGSLNMTPDQARSQLGIPVVH